MNVVKPLPSIAAGWRRTIGLKSDGTVVAVGRNNEGETLPVKMFTENNVLDSKK